MTIAPGICKRCGHTESYVGKLDRYSSCGNCANDLAEEVESDLMADLAQADYEQRLFDARQEAYYSAKEADNT